MTSPEDEPIPGVNILVKGTTKGTVTNIDGQYNLEVDENATLVFSFVGYVTEEVRVGGRTSINVSMNPDLTGLEEIVVIGYGTQKKIDLTGAVANIDAEDFKRTPVLKVSDALAGRMPGLNITSGSGVPGDNAEFRIRGVRSINGTNAPIFVVDGVITSDINNIAPNNIQSVSVLKDASSTSIYGARAGNGVIVITTKRGQSSGVPHLSFNTFVGAQDQGNLNLSLLNSDQFVEMYTEAFTNAGITVPWTDADLVQYEGVNTDWLDEMTRTGILQSYNLSVGGSSEYSNYYFAAGYEDNKGMVIGTDFSRLTFMGNSDHQIGKRIKFGNSLNLYSTTQNGNSDYYRTAAVKVPLTRAYEDDGSFGRIRNTALEHIHNNPVWLARENVNNEQNRGLRGNVYLTIDLLEGLEFTTRGSLNWNVAFDNRFIPGVPPDLGWEGSPLNSVSKERGETVHYIGDFLFNYEKQIGKDHNFKVLVGYSIEEWERETLTGERFNTPSNDIRFINAGDPTTMQSGDGFSDWAFLSTYGRINYIFKDKYLLTASVRRDETSRLADGNRDGVFPSVSVAWRLSEEDFITNSQFVNDLKIRASWGTVGNALSVATYGTVPALEQRLYAANQVVAQGFTNSNAINDDISWESTTKKNIGVDASVLNDRLYTTVDVFIEDTEDLLFQQPIPASTGYSDPPFINAGSVRNSGYELTLGYRQTIKDWNFDLNFNFSKIKNEVTDLEGRDLRTSGIVEGFPVRSAFGFRSNGIIQDQQTLDENPYLEEYGKTVGDIWALDINGFDENGNLTGSPDGVLNGADRTIIGNRYPEIYYGFMSTIGFKNFSLQIQLQGVHGIDKDVRGGNQTVFHYFNQWAMNHDARVLDRFNNTLNPDGVWPRVDVSDQGRNRELSEFWLHDASYLRIRNINLNYSFSNDIFEKIGMSNLGMYISVQNLHTFTQFGGPEVDTLEDPLTGIPQPRVWSVGLTANF